MLFLTGATVGVFVAQDLLLFYAFFEAMLIPLYILVGVWGGPGRLGATVKFVIYTMAGSLLMLAAIVVYGLKVGTFDLDRRAAEREPLDLPRLHVRVRDQGAALPVPRLAARRVPRGAAGGDRGPLRRDRQGGHLRDAADRDHEVPRADARTTGRSSSRSPPPRSCTARCSRSARPTSAASSRTRRSRRSGLIALGLFSGTNLGFDGAVLQMVAHGLVSTALFLIAGTVERRTTTGRVRAARRDGEGATCARDAA